MWELALVLKYKTLLYTKKFNSPLNSLYLKKSCVHVKSYTVKANWQNCDDLKSAKTSKPDFLFLPCFNMLFRIVRYTTPSYGQN